MRRALSWLRILLPAALLALVLWAVDPAAAWAELRGARIAPLAGALALSQVVIAASALRWADTARRLGQPLGRGEAIGEYYVSSLLNQVLPGGVAGDAVRAWRGRRRGGAARVARGVMIERLSGQVAVAAALILGLMLGGVPGTGRLVAAFLGGLALVLAGLALARGFGGDLRRAWATPGAALVQGGLNAAVAAALIAGFALCAHAVGTDLGWQAALSLVPVCLAAMLVPVGIGGLGLREGAAAVLWPLAGFAPEAGVAASVLFGLVALCGALPGAAILWRERRHQC